ncbi:hypothetical protein HYV80_03320 [Candidatus Woesearchaeota archaeon]|nr:hypothetical protein [Candidatus Woesearchaeota archaeon]
MAAFSRFLAKKKKTEVEELFSDIREESNSFEEFLRLHGEKVNYIKTILPEWNEGNASRIDLIIDKMLDLNKRLWTLINQIFQIEKKERALFYFIIKEKMNKLDRKYAVYKRQKDFLDKRKYQQYAKELDPYFEQLFDFLKSLSKLILRQTTMINAWGEGAAWRIVKDLNDRIFFYHLLIDETSLDRKIKQHLTLIIRTINQALGYEKRFGLQTKQVETERGKREIATSGMIFYEIRDQNSLSFEKFFKLYREIVKPDEREPKADLQSYISYNHLKGLMKNNATWNHLLVGIVKGRVIAANFFSPYLAQDKRGIKILFGVSWWGILARDYRGKRVQDLLYRRREQILQKDVQYFGVNALDAFFTEIDAPKKMKKEKIEEYTKRGDNPYVLEKFTRKQGFYEMRFDYIQPALGGGNPVTAIMLMIKPFKSEWIQNKGIPLDEMKLIWWFMVRYGFDRIPEKDKTYWDVLKNIEKSHIDGVIRFS